MSALHQGAGALSLLLYHFEPRVRVLGPGVRAGVWLQGCPRQCPGCIAPDTQPVAGGERVEIAGLVRSILAVPGLAGVTISGGDPFTQAEPLAAFLSLLRQKKPELTILLYTGFDCRELAALPFAQAVLAQTDLLIAGPFKVHEPSPDAWRGSANQEVIFLTERITPADLQHGADESIEFFVRRGGAFFMAGIPSRRTWDKLKKELFSLA